MTPNTPQLFDELGNVRILSEDELTGQSEEFLAAYDKLRDAHSQVMLADREIENTERRLRELIAEKREIETRLGSLRTVSPTQAARAVFEAHRRAMGVTWP